MDSTHKSLSSPPFHNRSQRDVNMAIHENGDETLRPTNAAWKCPHCGTELYTASCILSHKERCKEKKPSKEEEDIIKYEEERDRKIQESLKQFKIKHGIEIRKRRMNEQGAVRS